MRVVSMRVVSLAAVATAFATAAWAGGTEPVVVDQHAVHAERKLIHSWSLTAVKPASTTCLSACYIPLNFRKWADMPADSYWGMRIGSRAWMSSLVACMDLHCDADEIAAGWERLHWLHNVFPSVSPVPEYADVLVTLPPGNAIPVVDCLATRGTLGNATLLSTPANYQTAWRTAYAMQRQLVLHNRFGLSMFVFLGILVAIGLVNRMWAFVGRRRRAKDLEGGGYGAVSENAQDGGGVYTWYKKHIGTPAIGGYRHLQPAWWGFLSLPTRFEAMLIATYVGINTYFSFVEYDIFAENYYWYGQMDVQLARYVADRTGIMSFYNMILLWALAGRNDVLIWLTGWSFQSMNLFHRWTARVATLQAVVHSVGYAYLKRNALWAAMEDRYWATGVFATLFMVLLLPLSIRPLRTRMYEAFLLLHIACSFTLLVLLYFHVIQFGYAAWVWICFSLWAFDRLVRMGRVLLLNVTAIGRPNATAKLTAPDGLIRLSVDTSREMTPRPGDYYFVYSPLTLTPWENHPFTLASAEPAPNGGLRLHFLIMPLAGWTGRLARAIERGGADSRVLLEGPYGHAADISAFDRVLLIAGGSGIAAVLPYLATLPSCKVTLVWMVRNAEYAVDVFSHELAPGRTGELEVDLFVTRQDAKAAVGVLQACGVENAGLPAEILAGDGDGDGNGGAPEPRAGVQQAAPGVHVVPGRPAMDELVGSALGRLMPGERLAVVACGPNVMMDDLRRAIADSYGSGTGQVSGSTLEYFEEAFVW